MSASTKFFIGNLPYTTTTSEIENLLINYKDQIKSIEIPTSTRKNKKTGEQTESSKGFALIELNENNSIDSQSFIEFINNLNLNERQLFGKIGYTDEELKEKKAEKAERIKNLKKTKKAKAKKIENKEKSIESTESNGTTESNTPSEESKSPSSSPSTPTTTTTKSKSTKTKKPTKKLPIRQRKTKEEKAKKLEQGIPSKDTVFIGNLDDQVTSSDLHDLFKDYSPVFVKVPKKLVTPSLYRFLKSKNIPIKNTGVAFVKFSNNEIQQKIINEFNEKEFKGKVLNVTIAIDSKLPDNENENEKENEN